MRVLFFFKLFNIKKMHYAITVHDQKTFSLHYAAKTTHKINHSFILKDCYRGQIEHNTDILHADIQIL